jgi:hypothetical protein
MLTSAGSSRDRYIEGPETMITVKKDTAQLFLPDSSRPGTFRLDKIFINFRYHLSDSSEAHKPMQKQDR